MNPVTYFKETMSELRQVRWPTRQTTIQLTSIVIVVSLIVALYVGALDFSFTKLLSELVK